MDTCKHFPKTAFLSLNKCQIEVVNRYLCELVVYDQQVIGPQLFSTPRLTLSSAAGYFGELNVVHINCKRKRAAAWLKESRGQNLLYPARLNFNNPTPWHVCYQGFITAPISREHLDVNNCMWLGTICPVPSGFGRVSDVFISVWLLSGELAVWAALVRR